MNTCGGKMNKKINITLSETKYWQLRELLESLDDKFDDEDYGNLLYIDDGREKTKGILKEVLYAAGETNK